MSEPLLTLLLGIMAVCLVAITVTIMLTAQELRRTLRRVNALLPGTDRALRDVQDSLRQTHQLLTMTTGTIRRIESVVRQACDLASGFLETAARLSEQAKGFWHLRSGNGAAGAEPRSHRSATGRWGAHRSR